VGREELLDLSRAVYGDTDPLASGPASPAMAVRSRADGVVLTLPLPLAAQDDVRLARKGDELVVSVASYRRLLTLPSGLARHRVAGARVRDGELQVRFTAPATPPTETTTTMPRDEP
jgi:arsenite/tail-anchored protein-transporting ATPase